MSADSRTEGGGWHGGPVHLRGRAWLGRALTCGQEPASARKDRREACSQGKAKFLSSTSRKHYSARRTKTQRSLFAWEEREPWQVGKGESSWSKGDRTVCEEGTGRVLLFGEDDDRWGGLSSLESDMARGPWQHLACSPRHGVPHGGGEGPVLPLSSTGLSSGALCPWCEWEKGSRGRRPPMLASDAPCAPQMWMSARLGVCVTMASAPTHQAPSSVSASLATICQETGADARVSGPESWQSAHSSLPQDFHCAGSKPGTPLSSPHPDPTMGLVCGRSPGLWGKPWQPRAV